MIGEIVNLENLGRLCKLLTWFSKLNNRFKVAFKNAKNTHKFVLRQQEHFRHKIVVWSLILDYFRILRKPNFSKLGCGIRK